MTTTAWKQQFDQDVPRARADSLGHRVLKNADDPGEVFIMVEFSNLETAREGRERLTGSGVLDRFSDLSGPYVLEVAETRQAVTPDAQPPP